MKRRLYAPIVILIGLLSAEIVATVHLLFSNRGLSRTTAAIMRNGYLTVPSQPVADTLESLTTAMAGGLFFTLSIGAGLTLLTLIAVWVGDRMIHRRILARAVGVAGWSGMLILVNSSGWNPAATAYIVVVPAASAIAAIRLMPARSPLISPNGVFWPVAAVAILGLSWSLVADASLFANVRDYLLFPNRAGRSIVDAYYAYTLYPAEALKSLTQKQLRTCVLEDGLDRSDRRRLDAILRAADYLPLPAADPVDLYIGPGADPIQLTLSDGHGSVLPMSLSAFIDQPAAALSRFADQVDHQRRFRMLVLFGLLLALPVVLFTLLFNGLSLLSDLMVTAAVSDMLAALLCVVAGLILLFPVFQGHRAVRHSAAAADGLSATSAAIRIATLRQACRERRDVTPNALRRGIDRSENPAERYWLARSLAYARSAESAAALQALADDPVPIVACQALWAMGQRQERHLIPRLIQRIERSPHWYIQMYAYRALKELGWVQPRSAPLFS